MKYDLRGGGPPILFLHGIPAGRRLWDPVIERLAERFRCVAVDLPGMGESPPLADGSRDPARLAGELEALRRDLGFDHWHLVGHDAGATVAAHYAAGYPDRLARLVLMAPPIFPDFRPPWFFRGLRIPVLGDLLAPLVVFFIWNGGIQSIIERKTPVTEEILASFKAPFRGLRGARRLVWLVRWGKPRQILGRTAELLPRISAPTLILHGRRDGAIPAGFASRAAGLIPSCRAVYFDSGHFLPLNIPEDVAAQLSAFLGEQGDQ